MVKCKTFQCFLNDVLAPALVYSPWRINEVKSWFVWLVWLSCWPPLRQTVQLSQIMRQLRSIQRALIGLERINTTLSSRMLHTLEMTSFWSPHIPTDPPPQVHILHLPADVPRLNAPELVTAHCSSHRRTYNSLPPSIPPLLFSTPPFLCSPLGLCLLCKRVVYIHECAQTASSQENGKGIGGVGERKYSLGSSPSEKKNREGRRSVEIHRCT